MLPRLPASVLHMYVHTTAVWRYILAQLSMRDYRPRVMIIAIGYARWMRIRSRFLLDRCNFPIKIRRFVLIKSMYVLLYLARILWWEITILMISIKIAISCMNPYFRTERTILLKYLKIRDDMKIILLDHRITWESQDEQCCRKFWHSRNQFKYSTIILMIL